MFISLLILNLNGIIISNTPFLIQLFGEHTIIKSFPICILDFGYRSDTVAYDFIYRALTLLVFKQLSTLHVHAILLGTIYDPYW